VPALLITPPSESVVPLPPPIQIEEEVRNARGRLRTAAMQLGTVGRQLYRLWGRIGTALGASRTKLPPEDE
jgi:hypothetical protein